MLLLRQLLMIRREFVGLNKRTKRFRSMLYSSYVFRFRFSDFQGHRLCSLVSVWLLRKCGKIIESNVIVCYFWVCVCVRVYLDDEKLSEMSKSAKVFLTLLVLLQNFSFIGTLTKKLH
jgi:hypothetical protein